MRFARKAAIFGLYSPNPDSIVGVRNTPQELPQQETCRDGQEVPITVVVYLSLHGKAAYIFGVTAHLSIGNLPDEWDTSSDQASSCYRRSFFYLAW